MYIGLEDDVCPPETGFAVHDAMKCEKDLLTYERCGHDAGFFWAMEKVEEFLAEAPGGGEVTVSDADFAAYWDEVDAEVAALPARPVLERVPRRCDRGLHRLRGAADEPRPVPDLRLPERAGGRGPFPALLTTPRYGSVNNPPHYNDRLRYVDADDRAPRPAHSPTPPSLPRIRAC